jgi:hypothetical protein
VYRYGASGFPTDTFNATNYWVDAVFDTVAPPVDTTPPTVSSVNPASGAAGVAITTAVTATFSEAVNANTINTNTIQLRNPSNALIPATVTYDANTHTATLTPSAALAFGTTYTTTVVGARVE